jgi:hypothetical protein
MGLALAHTGKKEDTIQTTFELDGNHEALVNNTNIKVKVQQSRYRPGVTQRDPGS